MAGIEVGRKGMKLKGRQAGEMVEITKIIDKNFVEVKNSKGRTKRCNILHLDPI